jgi:hypothetical protein
MINVLAKDKNGLEFCVQTIYTIRQPSKIYKEQEKNHETHTVFPYVVKGTFSDPEPAWAEFFRLRKKALKSEKS